MSDRDWVAWHAGYENPTSSLSRRLQIVQRLLGDALAAAPEGRPRILSLCAGQGRDVIGTLRDHARRDDVEAVLVEQDTGLAHHAVVEAAAAGLSQVRVVVGDAGEVDNFADAVPADVVLACGIFGNISDEDVHNTIGHLPDLCASGGTVIWTRHREAPDLTVRIREWFAGAGFEELAFEPVPGSVGSVGAHRMRCRPRSLTPGTTLFRFLDAPGWARARERAGNGALSRTAPDLGEDRLVTDVRLMADEPPRG